MSINIYPDIIHEGDLSPDAFGSDVDDACKEIYKACKGFGTDEKRLIKALGSTTAEDRCKIALRYKQLHDKDLQKLMKKECSGDFGTALEFLALPSDVAEAAMIKKATAGLGTNEDVLYPIICGRSNAEIDILKKTFFKTYTKDLGKVLDSELGGDLESLVFNCLQGAEEEFDPDYHTGDKVKADAEAIYEAGQGKFGTDEKGLFKILCSSPPKHLQAVNLAYAEKYGYTLFKAFEKELRGTVEKAAIFTLGMKLKPYETIANLIKSACAGFGTNELLLTCSIIRYQQVMKQVMMAHIELFGKSVHDRVKSELRGDYEALLLKLLDMAWPDQA